MVLNIFQKKEVEMLTTTVDLRDDELQKQRYNHRRIQQQQHFSNKQPHPHPQPITQKAATTTLLPSPRLQKSSSPSLQEQQKPQQQKANQPQANDSKRRTYISHRINLPNANRSSSSSPPTKSSNHVPSIPETTNSGTTSPPGVANSDSLTPNDTVTTVNSPTADVVATTTNAPYHSPDLAKKSNHLKRGASPKESEVAKKTQISNEVLAQRRARRMRARPRPNCGKAITKRQQERRNSITSRESRESTNSQSILLTNEVTPLMDLQQLTRPMIDKKGRRKNLRSGRSANHDEAPKPQFSLPYPVNDEIISIIITDETDEQEELAETQEPSPEEASTNLSNLQIQEEDDEEAGKFPAGFEPINNTRSFKIGNIPRNNTYSAHDTPAQSPQLEQLNSPHIEPIHASPQEGRSEVHNDTLQQLTGQMESPTHASSQSHSSPMQPTSSQNSTYHMASNDFSISRTEAVACILERTGSTAQGSRRGQRYQEMRRRQRAQRNQTGQPQEADELIHEEPTMAGCDMLRTADQINALTGRKRSAIMENHNDTPSSPLHHREPSLSRRSTIEDTRARIIARLNQRIDPTMYPNEPSTNPRSHNNVEQDEEEAPPPLDEYANIEHNQPSTPPYRERLHKRVDLISFDPRYVTPVLRINKKLIRTPNNLRKTIRKLIQLKIVPEEIDLWKIDRIDDGQFYRVLPQLLNGDDAQQEIRAMNEAMRVARERTELEFELEIQRAIAISMEEQAQRQLFHGFRYNGPSRSQAEPRGGQGKDDDGGDNEDVAVSRGMDNGNREVSSDEDGDGSNDINDVFINVDDALRIWQQQEQQQQQRQRDDNNDDVNEDGHHLHPTNMMPGSFNYLLPAHTHSSVSSYMTAV